MMETSLEDLIPQRTAGDGPFLFSHICSLLDELDVTFKEGQNPNAKLKKAAYKARRISKIGKWAEFFQLAIMRDEQHLLATLSLLCPHRRSDRVYTMKEVRLVEVIPQAMGFAGRDKKILSEWKAKFADFGHALESLLKGRVMDNFCTSSYLGHLCARYSSNRSR
jgi:hypothetical protein